MNRRRKIVLSAAGLIALSAVEAYLKTKEQQKQNEKIEALIADVREEMANLTIVNNTTIVKDKEGVS